MNILNAPISGILAVWTELTEARLGVASLGSSVCEIYAYHLQPHNPLRHSHVNSEAEKAHTEARYQAASALQDIIVHFAREHECSVVVDGAVCATPAGLVCAVQPVRRWHVGIVPWEKSAPRVRCGCPNGSCPRCCSPRSTDDHR